MGDADESRRGALRHLVVLGGAAVGCAVAAPAVELVTAPVRRGAVAGERWVRTVPARQLDEGAPKKVAIVADERDAWTLAKGVELGAVWLVRRGEAVSAFSAVCPHLGCAVNAAADGSFACPCHTSTFAADGARVAGPAPRGMDPMTARVDPDGVVAVDFRRFRIGVAEREQIG